MLTYYYKVGDSMYLKQKKKGFTLIELLAVIIILGVLMLIAIPSVTGYISESRKKSYISTARRYIEAASILVNSGNLDVYDIDTSYYIPGSCLKMESGDLKSPYADWKDRYVIATYDGTSYDFYWASTDDAKMGIYITYSDKLTTDNVKTGVSTIPTDVGVGERSKIYVFNDDCSGISQIAPTAATSKIPNKGFADSDTGSSSINENNDGTVDTSEELTESGEAISIDNLKWSYKNLDVEIKIDDSTCYNDDNKKWCSGYMTVTNNNPLKPIVSWEVNFNITNGSEVGWTEAVDYVDMVVSNNKITLKNHSNQIHNNIAPLDTKKFLLSFKIPIGDSFALSSGFISYTLMSDGNTTGTTNTMDVTFNRNSYYVEPYNGSAERYHQFNYEVVVTNKTNRQLENWKIELKDDSNIYFVEGWELNAEKINGVWTLSSKGNDVIGVGESKTYTGAFRLVALDANTTVKLK